MANLVRIDADRVELPFLHLSHSITLPPAELKAGLDAFRTIRRDLSLQSLPLARRREVTDFLKNYGQLLHRTLFDGDAPAGLEPKAPLLLQLPPEWADYPWELLHDGQGWVALERGIIRLPHPPVSAPARQHPTALPMRLLAVTAVPLPDASTPVLTSHEQRLGTRFISVPWADARTWDGGLPGFCYEALPNASRNEFAHALRQSPHLLHFSGFTGPEGWILESPLCAPEPADLAWIQMQIEGAVKGGLRAVVLNDSLGLLETAAAGNHTRMLLETGLPAVVHIRGRMARRREQDYLHTLAQSMAGGFGVFESHVAGLRRLHRRFEAGWDWSFLQLHAAAPTNFAESTLDAIIQDAHGGNTEAVSFVLDSATELVQPPGAPAPPLFSGRRRAAGRHDELSRLAAGLFPQHPAANGVVHLWGPAGSGKTMLALEAARRMQREFDQIVYLHGRDLLPTAAQRDLPPESDAPPADSRGAPEFALLAQLIVHLALHPVSALPPDDWVRALKARLDDGQRRLFIIDRLDTHPGYPRLIQLLGSLPLSNRSLLLSRHEPPAGSRAAIALQPLPDQDFLRIYDEEFLERLRASPHAESLLRLCREDLLLGRMLRRLAIWPGDEAIATALTVTALPATTSAATGAPATEAAPMAGKDMIALVFGHAAASLSLQARRILEAMTLFATLVHRDVLTALTELDSKALNAALAELQWLGLIDGYQDDAYLALPPRLQTPAAEQFMNGNAYAVLRQRMLRCTFSYLADLERRQDGLGSLPDGSHDVSWCWCPQGANLPPGMARASQRLAIERVHLAEMTIMLEEDAATDDLVALAHAANALHPWPQAADVYRMIHRALFRAGSAAGSPGLEADALNQLAAPLVAAGQWERALPLLEQGLHLASQATEQWDILASIYSRLSRCYLRLGRTEPAENLLQASIELARQLGSGPRLVDALGCMLDIWKAQGQGMEQGQHVLLRNIAELESRNQPGPAARLQGMLAQVHLVTGHISGATQLLNEALSTLRAEQDGEGIYHILLGLAEVALAKNDPEQATLHYHQALECGAKTRNETSERDVLAGLCTLHEQNRDYDKALETSLQLREVYERLSDREALIALLDNIGGLYYQLGQQADSTRVYQDRLRLLDLAAPDSEAPSQQS